MARDACLITFKAWGAAQAHLPRQNVPDFTATNFLGTHAIGHCRKCSHHTTSCFGFEAFSIKSAGATPLSAAATPDAPEPQSLMHYFMSIGCCPFSLPIAPNVRTKQKWMFATQASNLNVHADSFACLEARLRIRRNCQIKSCHMLCPRRRPLQFLCFSTLSEIS